VQFQAPAVFKNFVQIIIFEIMLQAKKAKIFGFALIEMFFEFTKNNVQVMHL